MPVLNKRKCARAGVCNRDTCIRAAIHCYHRDGYVSMYVRTYSTLNHYLILFIIQMHLFARKQVCGIIISGAIKIKEN